ncbi:helix-turn-helix transcriptional regulator [Rhizobium sp. Root1220]|uniref:helix-turn-helix transcriptional regulator n=1 Tax=Rhizobium sp. Root1220 TaxID=1736432 RepID=UPI0006F29702|nr:helix-turn-helix transcriptional regulator [Rhizobium sp. Root1220]KQV70209.1 hypothetical protein ASC90_08750 [Rhizobium sp. Root1220]
MTDHVRRDARPANEVTPVSAESRLAFFRSALEAIAAQHGLQFYMAGFFPEADKVGLLENLIVSNWPSELLRKYESTDIFRESRIVSRLKNTILPIAAGNLLFARARDDGLKSELLGIFYDNGFKRTVGLSLHDADRKHYLILLSGDREVSEDQEVATLVYDIMKALDAYSAMQRRPAPGEILAAREIECLRWSAAGKSSEEIAIILGISAHTVNSYLKSAIRKLDSTNRMQAVAAACRLRLL